MMHVLAGWSFVIAIVVYFATCKPSGKGRHGGGGHMTKHMVLYRVFGELFH